jgi:D-alanyl-D-alanine carboxypeptidase
MTDNQSARAAARHIPATIFVAAVVLNAALIGVFVVQSLTSPSSSAAPPTDVNHGAPRAAPELLPRIETAPAQPPRIESAPDGQLPSDMTIADGAVPDGVTVFEDDVPAVANLDPNLLGALRNAATVAESDGVEFVVNSGWRSPEYQEQLLQEAISQYGSEQEAARWVATPNTSAHVSGHAVDIGPSDAAVWLPIHGAAYGLCQIYGNEPWHYELRPEAVDSGCPPPYADATQDPRMQK